MKRKAKKISFYFIISLVCFLVFFSNTKVLAQGSSSLEEILREEGYGYNITDCLNYFLEHGNSPREGYAEGFFEAGCRNYKTNGYFYGSVERLFFIDSSVSEKNVRLIKQQVDIWNGIVMHDGTPTLVDLQEVTQIDEQQKYNGKTVLKIIEVPFLTGDVDALFERFPYPTISLEPNIDADAFLHEIGHFLGLGDLDGEEIFPESPFEMEEDGSSSWAHSTLMGYNRLRTDAETAIHYQDIQGVAVINGTHSNHVFDRYGYSETFNYVYSCFYCDCAYAVDSPIVGTEELEYAVECEHSYRPLVSAGDRHWSKCIYCYKVIEKETFNISYKDVGGTTFSGTHPERYPTTYAYETETQLKTPAKIGKTFVGWFLNQNGTGEPITVIAGAEFDSDITLYAKWENGVYNISYQDVGGAAFSGEHADGYPTTHTYETETNLPSPTRSNAAFVGWYTNSLGMGNPVTSLFATGYTEDITLYAKWIETYTIVYMDVGGLPFSGTHKEGTLTTLSYGGSTKLKEPNKDNYTFGGWYTAIDAYGEKIQVEEDEKEQGVPLVGAGTSENLLVFAKWVKANVTAWNGTVASGFAGGSGSYDSPWQIENGEQLAYMAQIVNNGLATNAHYVLIADIYLNDVSDANWRDGENLNVWTPMGTPTDFFNGDFNGAGHAIYGLYINTTTSQQGLFRTVKEGVVRNLGIEDSYVRGGSYVGSIAGTVNAGTIVNCYNTGTIVGNNSGGIVGRATNGSVIKNNYNTCPMSGGGIVGNCSEDSIVDYNYYLQTETINNGVSAIYSGKTSGANYAVDLQGNFLSGTVVFGEESYSSIPAALNAFVNEGCYVYPWGDLVLWHWVAEENFITSFV